MQQAARRDILEPMQTGPVGQMGETSRVQSQTAALLPASPAANSEGVVARAVGALAARDPEAARNLLRQHLETTFNDATSALQAGPNVMGGATFAKDVAGNPQQATNLEAAVRALPGGDTTWEGVNRFLDTARATGFKPAKGSDTAFNAELQQRMKQPSSLPAAAAEAAAGAATGASVGGATGALGAGALAAKHALDERFMRWKMGQNGGQIAEMLTNPQAQPLLNLMARAQPGSRTANLAAMQLLDFADRMTNERRKIR